MPVRSKYKRKPKKNLFNSFQDMPDNSMFRCRSGLPNIDLNIIYNILNKGLRVSLASKFVGETF